MESNSRDGTYISRYLTHWTEKKNILETIANTSKLKLTPNPLHEYDFNSRIDIYMTCFTDIPLHLAKTHCSQYGKYGIAFDKKKLINIGAQPVFYWTPNVKDHLDNIFKYITATENSIPVDFYRALKHHFALAKKIENGKVFGKNTTYYEREWRITDLILATEEQLRGDNPRYHLSHDEGYPHQGRYGIKVIEGDDIYFRFEKDDVAFLIVPKEDIKSIENNNGFKKIEYESLC